MSGDDGVLLYAYRGCLFRIPEGVQPPKAGSLFFCRHLPLRAGDRMLEVGAGERFDLVCGNLPQMPTPPDRQRGDSMAAADNGGVDGWELLDRLIEGARDHLRPRGRLVFSIFAFLGRKTALDKLEAVGLEPTVIASERQAFPRIGYERIEHIRSVDREATLPRTGFPQTVERLIIQGGLRP